MFRTLLVPLDGSRFGEHALPRALTLARQCGAALHLVHVHVPAAPMYMGGEMLGDLSVDMTLRKREKKYLEELVARVRAVADAPVTASLMDGGSIIDGLLKEAKDHQADLIVMTTHGRGAFSRFWLGSVADQLVRQSPVPLLLVRPHEGEPILTVEETARHILVPLDGSPLAEQILEPAVAVAPPDAEFALLRVTEPTIPVDYVGGEGYIGSFGQSLLERLEGLEKQERADAAAYLERHAEQLRSRGFRVQTRVVTHAQPSVAILDDARNHPTDLIALETHGRSGLARLFLGSVADKIVRSAALPILLHRAPAGVKTEPVVEMAKSAPAPEVPGCIPAQATPLTGGVS